MNTGDQHSLAPTAGAQPPPGSVDVSINKRRLIVYAVWSVFFFIVVCYYVVFLLLGR